ncbi:MAG TPA: hypothetical protein ENI22_00700 [Candidatus Pacearchaeota archaeon]|nr:hypothetical protein [Candidatus Pacearchaeota archaeon]
MRAKGKGKLPTYTLHNQPGFVMRALAGLGGTIVNFPKNWAARRKHMNSPEGLAEQAKLMQSRNILLRHQIERNKLLVERNKLQAGRDKVLRDATRGMFGG